MLRRQVLVGLAVLAGQAATAQPQMQSTLPVAPSSKDPFARLKEGGATMDHLMPGEGAERVFDSPAPQGPAGRWVSRAALALPRSEMAWGTAWAGRLHVVGGYGEGRVDRTYHHVYDPTDDKWFQAAPLPRGANHVAVIAHAGRVYALGGFVEQNTAPVSDAYAYDVSQDRWEQIAPLPRPRGGRWCGRCQRRDPSYRRGVGP